MSPQTRAYLIFSLNSSLYGVDALSVQEIFFLPELTPVHHYPQDIVGVLNLRGEFLPIADLNIRLGYRAQEYCLTDSVIVIELCGLRIGIIVNEVREVHNLDAHAIAGEGYGREAGAKGGLVTQLANIGSDIVMLLNPETLLRGTALVEALTGAIANPPLADESDTQPPEFVLTQQRLFCPNATTEERTIFRRRAANLMVAVQSEQSSGLMSLAVIGLNGEYFALDLEFVREFIDIRIVKPIPCCPPHIIGNMNIRGEIVTLVDIRGVITLMMSAPSTASKAMIVNIKDIVAGVMVDEVFDVMYLNPSEIMPVPTAVNSLNKDVKFLRGTAWYGDKVMAILDMQKIISEGGLIVDEEV